MALPKPINLSALKEHRVTLRLWLGIIFVGLFIFIGLLVLSYFVLNAPSITHNVANYKRAEA